MGRGARNDPRPIRAGPCGTMAASMDWVARYLEHRVPGDKAGSPAAAGFTPAFLAGHGFPR